MVMWAEKFMAQVAANTIEDDPGRPVRWARDVEAAEVELARACWRRHRDQVTWRGFRPRACTGCGRPQAVDTPGDSEEGGDAVRGPADL
jgi:hypothetical protein